MPLFLCFYEEHLMFFHFVVNKLHSSMQFCIYIYIYIIQYITVWFMVYQILVAVMIPDIQAQKHKHAFKEHIYS